MHSLRWAVLMALVITTPAYADPPKSNTAAKVENKADKAKDKIDKADKAKDKIDDKADKAKDKIDDKAEPPKVDKEAVKKKAKEERDELKGKVQKALKGKPMHAALKQELRRHAQRLARLERIQELAKAGKDDDTADKAKKLIEKENDRHEKWMSKFDPSKEGAK
jgi:hypothetical protein